VAVPVPSSIALEFTKGDTVAWTQNFTDYPANDSWVLTYYLRGPGAFDVTAAASGSDHLVAISAASSADLVAGRYRMTGVVTKGAERYTVWSGQVLIHENWATQEAGFDARSHARRCLEAIEAVLEGRATRSDSSYQIAGRSVVHYSFEELLKMRDYYLMAVAREESLLRGTDNKIYARFNEWR
jgi:hypothetical protein